MHVLFGQRSWIWLCHAVSMVRQQCQSNSFWDTMLAIQLGWTKQLWGSLLSIPFGWLP